VADDVDLLVLGAGIAGVTAARSRAGRHPHTVILEAADSVGGVAGVFRVGDFRFDYGLHCFFTAYPQVEALLEDVMAGAHERRPLTELVWHDGGWRPYPAARNLAAYPEEVARQALADLPDSPPSSAADNAVAAGEAAAGRYLTRKFVVPQLRKYWATEPERLPAAVARAGFAATPDEIRAGAVRALDDPPTRSWSYPARGGFATYVERLATGLDIRYATRATRIDPAARVVETGDGSGLRYRRLVSSIPLPRLLAMVDGAPSDLVAATAALGHTAVHLVSLGVTAIDAPAPWVYDIDPRVPWFRATFPSEYSPGSAPDGLASVQTESYSAEAPTADEVIASLRWRGLLPPGAEVVCRDSRTLPYASTLLRPSEAPVVRDAIGWLTTQGITTVGRYGRWDNAKFDVVMARTDELIGGRTAVAV
jgi:protoporphyrinogen oxidase